jgi:NADPH:quinone reductase-like Zn-dependent oxidoreductase
MPHKGIWVDEHHNFTVKSFETPDHCEDDEIVVKVAYNAVNPADGKHPAHLGTYNNVVGYDFSGIVVHAGSKTTFSAGDRVLGLAACGVGRPASKGAFQEFMIAEASLCFHIPEHLSLELAASLPVVFVTAVDELYNILELAPPPAKNKGPILICGGTSAVGYYALQLAHVSGLSPILVTASPKNFQKLEEAGATACFDYHDPDVATKIKSVLQKTTKDPLLLGVDAPGTSLDLLHQCCDANAHLVSSLGGPGMKIPFAAVLCGKEVVLQGIFGSVVPARPEDAKRARQVIERILPQIGKEIKPMRIELIGGKWEDLIKTIIDVEKNSSPFCKFVFRVPHSGDHL